MTYKLSRYITKNVKIEAEEKSNGKEVEIRLMKGNEEIVLTLEEIIAISGDLEFLVDSALYDLECIRTECK